MSGVGSGVRSAARGRLMPRPTIRVSWGRRLGTDLGASPDMILWPKPVRQAQISPDQRTSFESAGTLRVATLVANGTYSIEQARQARDWLREQEEKNERPNLIRYYVLTWIAGLTLVSTIIGIAVTLTK